MTRNWNSTLIWGLGSNSTGAIDCLMFGKGKCYECRFVKNTGSTNA